MAASSAAVELGRRLLLAARAGDTAQVLDLMAKGAPFTADWVRAPRRRRSLVRSRDTPL